MFLGVRTLRRLNDLSSPQDLKALWRRYIIALALIFGLLMTSHIVSREALHQGAQDASTINMSGRQRMLLQRIAHIADDYSETYDLEDRNELQTNARLFEESHAKLISRSQSAKLAHNLYTGGSEPLNQQIQAMLLHVDRLLDGPENGAGHAKAVQQMADGVLARRLNDAVSTWETVSDRRRATLTQIQDLSLMAGVLMLFAEILLIFWPSHQTISRAFERLQAESDTSEQTLDRLSNFASVAADLFWETDAAGHMIYAEGSFLERMKGGRETIVGCDYRDIIQYSGENLEILRAALQSFGAYKDIIGTFTDIDGQTYKMSMSGKPHYNDRGRIIGYIGTATDVTEKQTRQEETELLASTDPLTGLANVRKFRAAMDKILVEATSRNPVHVLALDLDGFKAVNDTYGHGAGDEVLKAVAARMQSTLRESDWCARIGGDEFFVVCQTAPSRLAAEGLAMRLNRQLAEPYSLSSGHRVRVSASIGIAAAPFDCMSTEPLLKAADMALYESKGRGRNQYCFYEDLGPFVVDEQAFA